MGHKYALRNRSTDKGRKAGSSEHGRAFPIGLEVVKAGHPWINDDKYIRGIQEVRLPGHDDFSYGTL